MTTRQGHEVEKVGVLRALPGLGDLLCLVPALRAVRGAWPGSHVTLLGLGSAGWFPQRFPHLVDDLLIVAGVDGLPEVAPDPTAERTFVRRAVAARFDLVLQLHGDGRVTNGLARRLGGRRWQRPGPTAVDRPEILRLLDVVVAAGAAPLGDHLELPVTADEEAAAAGLVPAGDAFACLHAGASVPERAWTVDGFAAVGDHLAGYGLAVALTGTDGDRPRVAAVARRMAAPVVDLVGRTGIGVLGALYRRAELVVSNDTGAAHVAVAVGAPSIVVTAAAEPRRWAPLDQDRHPTVAGRPGWPALGAVVAAIDRRLGAEARGAR